MKILVWILMSNAELLHVCAPLTACFLQVIEQALKKQGVAA